MASVSSLDKDLRKLRLDKYTPTAANEVKAWIEGILGERLPAGDLLEGLKDGVALCKLVNLAIPPPGVRFKQSAMPFVQMENISLFLRACKSPPLNLQEHDVFLTVDLYEQKDPAQVLQCIGAFSRAANGVNPSAFPTAIGPRSGRGGGGVLSPQSTGPATPNALSGGGPLRSRGMSNVSNTSSAYNRTTPTLAASKTGDSGSGRWSPTKSPTKSPSNNGSGSPVSTSSWSRKEHEGATAPAWNIAQYGYMGGASQGNLGIAFGGRRQITSAAPYVPNAAEKERRRKEAEAERQRQLEEEELKKKAEREAEEERARLEEERRWEEETRRLREEERRQAEEERRRWEEEERQWKLTEERRRREEEEAEARLQEERRRARSKSDVRLRGQLLSQYRAEHQGSPSDAAGGYGGRVKELEKELELARQREAEYERERRERHSRGSPEEQAPGDKKSKARSRSRPGAAAETAPPPSRQDSWSVQDDRHLLRAQYHQRQRNRSRGLSRDAARSRWQQEPELEQEQEPEPAAPVAPTLPARSPRPLPDPTATISPPPAKVKTHRTGGDGPPPVPIRQHHTGSRPLPDPAAYASSLSTPVSQPAAAPAPFPTSRTTQYPPSNPPLPAPAQQTHTRELGSTAERDAEERRRVGPAAGAGQKPSKAGGGGGWAGKSLLEREMEMERQRQREWEEAQKETAKAARTGDGVEGIGGGVGGRWDVSQWSGYAGGDSQNRGGQGIGAGRRQIVGPRPLPGSR